jgi:hypothetical protein
MGTAKAESSQGYDPNDPRFVAVHEAGHAVSAIVLGLNLASVDIKRRRLPDGGISMGFTDTGKTGLEDIGGKGEEAALPHVIQSLTGALAESKVNERLMECNGH